MPSSSEHDSCPVSNCSWILSILIIHYLKSNVHNEEQVLSLVHNPQLDADLSWIKYAGTKLLTSRCSNWISKRQRNHRSNCQHPLDHRKSKSQKNIYSALSTRPKPLTVWIITNCGKFLKRWEYQTTLPASWEIYMQVKKQQLELDMEQQTGSIWGKEYVKGIYCHPALFNLYSEYIMQNAGLDENTSWNQDCWEKYW